MGVSVDSAVEAEGFFEAVAAEPSAVVEDGASEVIDENDGTGGGGVGKEVVLEVLGHELGFRKGDGLEFLAGAGVKEGEGSF